jgi:hypothetical protein
MSLRRRSDMDRRSFVKRAGVQGTRETTYRDRALVRRLVRAAGKRGVI